MSLILDALKKSEEKRQLGQPPTLGSTVVPIPQRRRGWPFLLLATVLLALAGWGLNIYIRPHALVVPVAAVVQPPAASVALPHTTSATPVGGINPAPAVSPPSVAAPLALPAVAPPLVTRTASQSISVFGARKPMPPAAVAPHGVAPPPDASRIATAVKTAPTPAPENPPAPTVTAPVPAVPTAVVATDNAKPVAPAAKSVPAYYELAFPIRKDLPAIKISMHVYALDPTQRFVVINGSHQGEGDAVDGGVIVREIRPTDVVLEFQGKIFSVPRNGI